MMRQAEEMVIKAIQNVVDYAPVLDKVRLVKKEIETLAKKAVKTTLATLAMPRKVRAPQKRRVQQVKYELVFIRDPMVRAQPKYIGCWSLLQRENVALRPTLDVGRSQVVKKSCLRCIVEIYEDPVTKWVLIRLLQDEVPTEESSPHEDMGIEKSQLSDLTSIALSSDILLRPEDVRRILSKPHNWPAVHIKKEIVKYVISPTNVYHWLDV
jgi:hypothetical protein